MKKKLLLFLFSCIYAATLLAQENEALTKFRKEIDALLLENKNNGARAAFLPDSIKKFTHQGKDSSLHILAKNKFLQDGKLKSQDMYAYYSPTNYFYQRQIFYYDTSKIGLKQYIETYNSKDGKTYTKDLIDTFAYDKLNREILTTQRNPNTNKTINLVTKQYKTNFAIPDSIKNYTYDIVSNALVSITEEANVLDDVGKIKTKTILNFDEYY